MAKAQPINPLLDPGDTAILFIDHQSGLLQTVKDIGLAELRINAAVLARAAALLDIPVIATASVPEGPNGPLIPEIVDNAPHAVFVPRQGEINAWDNEAFVAEVRDAGKSTLVMAGIWTSVCVALPAVSARQAGYGVHAVIDASGDVSWMASQITLMRVTQAGVIPTSTNAVVAELQQTWNRREAEAFAELYAAFSPDYLAVIESYRSAREGEDAID